MEGLHPKAKGNVGEARIAAELMGLGYAVFTEMGDLSRTDLIVERPDGRTAKVQVKCRKSKYGAVTIDQMKSGPGYRYRYQLDDVDVFAVYVYDTDDVLFIPARVICTSVRRKTTFRLRPARNGQKYGTRAARDFRSFDAAAGWRDAPVAQLVEHSPFKRKSPGSIPGGGTDRSEEGRRPSP